jgi:hypothetical protein
MKYGATFFTAATWYLTNAVVKYKNLERGNPSEAFTTTKLYDTKTKLQRNKEGTRLANALEQSIAYALLEKLNWLMLHQAVVEQEVFIFIF